MIKNVTLKTGLELSLDTESLDDFELVELLSKYEEGDIATLPKILLGVLGPDQYKKVKSHLKEKYGKIKLELINEVVSDIFNGLNEKN